MSFDILELNGEIFKILASNTRRNILKSLCSRRKTVSELSRELQLAKSTVHKHLDRMIDSGLIVKQENTNQFVYYELTKKGRDILRQDESIRIKILLTVSLFTFIGGAFETYRFIKRIILVGGRPSTYDLITGVVLIIIALILFNFTFRAWRKAHLIYTED